MFSVPPAVAPAKGRVMLSSELQPANAERPIEVTVAGTTASVMPVQLLNALSPICFNSLFSAIDMVRREVRS